MKKLIYITTVALIAASCTTDKKADTAEFNDSTQPLHLMKPDYKYSYGVPEADSVRSKMDAILHYLHDCTPTQIVDRNTGAVITDYTDIDSASQLARGTFRLTSYEWGVIYSAMLAAGEATGNDEYTRYATDRMKFLSDAYPTCKALYDKGECTDRLIEQFTTPKALDDAGAICAAMIKAQTADSTLQFSAMIDNYSDYILNKEHRLSDGTFARNRPHTNTVWLDDMFMGVPTVIYMSKYRPEEAKKYQQEAINQIRGFKERMWVPDKQLFRHGWVESMPHHPAFFWGRANGWALLTLTEVLDALPSDHPDRQDILDLYKNHIAGLLAVQGKDGLWHQLLDRPDTYEETSATAIYTYCIAHGINEGWLDPQAYGPPVILAWNALANHITPDGKVHGTCVGTGMGFDPAFYAYRPVSALAAHAYGPAIWAGSEVLRLINGTHPQLNDSGLQFYLNPQNTDEPIFNEK